MARKRTAEVHSLMILLNNLQRLLVAADDIRDQISWFCEQIEVMFGFLLVYYSEEVSSTSDHHHHQHHVDAAGASSNDDEMSSKVVAMIRDFAVESSDVVVDTFEEIIAKQQLHTTSRRSSATRADGDEDDEPLHQLACNDNPAAPLGLDVLEVEMKSIVSFIHTYYSNDVDCYRMACKKAAEDSAQLIPPHKSKFLIGDGIPPEGLETYVSMMAERLFGNREAKPLEVIAITGEGGTGKTTLARMIHIGAKNYISCVWISVSKAYVLRDLLLSLLNDIMVSVIEEIHEMDEWELKKEIRKQLRGRLYIIVIDDVWDTKAWDDLKDLFPDDSNCSRILITTRFPWVASYAIGSGKKSLLLPEDAFGIPMYEYAEEKRFIEMMSAYECFELKPLSPNRSLALFYNIYFFLFSQVCSHIELEFSSDDDEVVLPKGRPSWTERKYAYHSFLEKEVVSYGRRILRSCCGRPLLISVVARILNAIDRDVGISKKRDAGISSWSKLAGGINKELTGDYEKQMDILTLCFRLLPRHLQSCFLYLGVFPEDNEISARQLIQLWIAEGLIQLPPTPQELEDNDANRTMEEELEDNDANRTMEDVAEDYLENLITLGLVRVSKETLDGRAKSFYIHEMLRDFCIHLSNEEGFLEVHTGGDHDSSSSTGTTGHQTCRPKKLSILGNCRDYLSNSINSSTGTSSCSHLRSFSCFSQDTQTFSKQDWRSLFQHFRLLRVLNLGEQEAQNKLDDSIGNLVHLRYLKLKPAKKIPVPISAIFNLWNLQTVDLRKASFSRLPVEIWKMQQLRHLYLGGQSRFPKAKSEDRLPNLLTLSYISNDPRGAIRIAEKAPNLRKLGLNGYRCASKAEQEATFNLQHLQSLKFAEECNFFIQTIKLPAAITKTTVKRALLQSNAIGLFGKLRNLKVLKLQTNFYNERLVFLGGDFPKLQVLKIANSNIVTWIVNEWAMESLRHVVFSCCSQLQKLPEELQDSCTLRKLELLWCSEELVVDADKYLGGQEHLQLVIYPPQRNQMGY